ncbi:MAG: DUF4286 family protein [Flavobacteriales bacterium]|nr:DUF4286 family protein [Flavobacteriales bacterium]MCB9449184.1 DUF4286 family protein [Flavobacteriales bacterium]
MIIYNVTVNIDDEVHDEWLEWMKSEHIPEVMATGAFIESRMARVLSDDPEGKTYAIQYTCMTMNDYEKYREEHAPALQEKVLIRYKDRFVAFRTLLEVI